jgi:two-component system nitrate/nitrite sensor histidine kinase NarX
MILRSIPDSRPLPRHRHSTLRARLLVRLGGLLLVLLLLALTVGTGHTGLLDPARQILVTVLLLIAGGGLAYSILALVQSNLLDPLADIRSWARRVREGRYADPIPTPAYEAFAELADDLVGIAVGQQPGPDTKDGAEAQNQVHDGSLQTLYEVVSSINTAHGLDDLLTRFLFTLKRITQAQAAIIWVSHKPGHVELAASSGIDEALLLPGRKDIRRCLYERALTEGRIWVNETLENCEKIAGRPFFGDNRIGLVSFPMRYRGRIIGVINLFLDRDMLDHVDPLKPLLTSVGHHLSIAIERFRNDEDSRQHLLNEERTRIAHELHDSLAQSLASLRYQVRVLDETMHQGDESTTWQQLERIENSLDESNAELRELIANFRAPVSQQGLVGAIEQMVSQFRNESHIKTFLQKEWAADDLPKDTEIQILRIMQEALWNIRKHSQAQAVRIMLRHDRDSGYYVLIEDDGVGFGKQVYGSPGEHVGLAIMRERALRFGGDLRIESEPGEGTRVILAFSQPVTEGHPA